MRGSLFIVIIRRIRAFVNPLRAHIFVGPALAKRAGIVYNISNYMISAQDIEIM